jgi:hypothetical protein
MFDFDYRCIAYIHICREGEMHACMHRFKPACQPASPIQSSPALGMITPAKRRRPLMNECMKAPPPHSYFGSKSSWVHAALGGLCGIFWDGWYVRRSVG